MLHHTTHKWHSKIILIIKELEVPVNALIDSGADFNYISEGTIPSRFFKKTFQVLNTAKGEKILVRHKLSNITIYLNEGSIKMDFLVRPNLTKLVILGTPFLSSI